MKPVSRETRDLSLNSGQAILYVFPKTNNRGSMANSRGSFLQILYSKYMGELRGYLRKTMARHESDAEDIAQSAFLKLAAQDNPEAIDNPRAYLYQTARNLMIDEGRKKAHEIKSQKRGESCEVETDERSPEQAALYRQALTILQGAINNLPAKRRRVFMLSRVHHMSYEDIARETGLSKAGVKQHIVRALADCRNALESGDTSERQYTHTSNQDRNRS